MGGSVIGGVGSVIGGVGGGITTKMITTNNDTSSLAVADGGADVGAGAGVTAMITTTYSTSSLVAAVGSSQSSAALDVSASASAKSDAFTATTTVGMPATGDGQQQSSSSFNDGFVSETITVNDCDVLFGRGKNTREHIGNIRCTDWVKKYLKEYNTVTNVCKTEISQKIVQNVFNSGGRFLKKDKKVRIL